MRYAAPGLLGEQQCAEVTMWQDSLRLTVQVLTGLARLDLGNWMATIEQQKADMLAATFQAALAVAGLPPDRAQIARAALVSRLRVLSDEDEPGDDDAISGVVIPARGRGRGDRA